MLAERHLELLTYLDRARRPVPGEELAARLQVSARTVRHYVAQINRTARADLVTSSHLGYRLDDTTYRAFVDSGFGSSHSSETPGQRMHGVVAELLRHPDGLDIRQLASRLHVSTSTIEADLVRSRALLREYDLSVRREREWLELHGSERQRRRVLRQILAESARGSQSALAAGLMGRFSSRDQQLLRLILSDALRDNSLDANEYVMTDLVMHLMIAVDRVRQGYELSAVPGSDGVDDSPMTDVATQVAGSVRDLLDVELPPVERRYIALLLSFKTIPRETRDPSELRRANDVYYEMVCQITAELSQHYLVDLTSDRFLLNMGLHVRNLVARMRAGERARNPVATAFKQAHPLIHELSVFFARQVELREGIEVDEDEIAFLSFHIGSQLQSTADDADRISIVCLVPRYHSMHNVFREQLARSLPPDAVIESVVTTAEQNWASLDADLIVSSVPLPQSGLPPVVTVTPLLSRADLDNVAEVVRGLRERRNRARLRGNLVELLDPLFIHHVSDIETREQVLDLMVAPLLTEGVVGPHFLDDVMERERLSPTAFGSLAVPHSLHMDQNRTAISVLVSQTPISWGGSTVRLVVMFTFAPDGRSAFRRVFDQLILTLSEPANVQTLTTAGSSYEDLLTALFGVLD